MIKPLLVVCVSCSTKIMFFIKPVQNIIKEKMRSGLGLERCQVFARLMFNHAGEEMIKLHSNSGFAAKDKC